MKITFLIHDIYGIGGTNRTTLNLAAALADDHDVTVVSFRRHRATPLFKIDPRITVVPLVDARAGSADSADPLFARPSRIFPATEPRYKQYSRLVDRRAEQYLRGCPADVIIGTRPGINVYLARLGPRTALRIAQEHVIHDAHSARLRAELQRRYRTLDAVVTMTRADAAVYRERMRLPGVLVRAVPNAVPDLDVPPSDGSAKVVAAAGRLVRAKRFDLLIEAFAQVADEQPDWSLRIYGSGTDRDRLAKLIAESGVADRVSLMGVVSPIEKAFAQVSIVASASDTESFGMTLVEAMRCGVPVISTDCPLGPAEIITDGEDGVLVPVNDTAAFADALRDLMTDDQRRRRMAATARESSRRFGPAAVSDIYETLFADLAASRGSRTGWQRLGSRLGFPGPSAG